MAKAGTVTTKGLKEFIRAADAAGKETKKQVRDTLRKVAEPVKVGVQRTLSQWGDPGSASRVGISVRRTGIVAVEQRHPKTTGLRPDYGVKQMRDAFLPELEAQEGEIERGFERAVAEIADIFEKR